MPSSDQSFPANNTDENVGSFDAPAFQPPPPPPVKSEAAPWGIGMGLLVWLISIVLMFIVPIFFVLPYAVSVGLKNFDPLSRTSILLQVLAIFPTHFVTFVIIWAAVTRFGKLSFWTAVSWGWEWGQLMRLVTCIGLGVLLFGVGAVIAKLLGADKPTQLEQIINSSLAARYAISFLAVFTAPLVEELMYRGVLFAPLQRHLGVGGAVGIVLLLFTMIHVPQYWPNAGVILAVGMLSVVLTLVRAYTGRLMPCVVIHLVFNGVQAILLIIEPHLPKLAPPIDPAVPPAAMIISTLQQII